MGKTGEGFDNLEHGISMAIEQAKLGVMEIPKYYLDVGVWILQNKKSKPKLSWKEFEKEHSSLNEVRLDMSCRFLSNMGFCYYNQNIGIMVTDLQWLSDMFKGLITFVGGFVVDGIVFRSKLNQKIEKWLG